MKRMLALLLALLMLTASAAAESISDGSYEDLHDKLYRQAVESGLRGGIQLTVSGDSETAQLLSPLSEAILYFYTQNQTADHPAYVECYFSKNGVQNAAATTLWQAGEALYLRSDMLLDTVLRFPWQGDILSGMTGGRRGNPSFLSAFASALIHGRNWDVLAQPLTLELERFMANYAGTPTTQTQEGETLVSIRYTMPAPAVKAEMKNLLRLALENEQIRERVRQFYLTDLQEGTAFSNLQLTYEDQVIDSIAIEGDVTVTRTMNTRGEVRSLVASLPLMDNPGGYSELVCTSEGGVDTYILKGSHPLTLSVQEGPEGWSGTLDAVQEEKKHLLADWRFACSTTTSVDESQVEHEVVVWSFSAEPAGDEVAFAEVNLSGNLHLYAKRGEKRSRTTLEMEVSGRLMGAEMKLIGKMYSITPKDVPETDTTGAVDALSLTEERKAELNRDFWVNLLLILDGAGKSTQAPAGTPVQTPAETPAAEAPAQTEAPGATVEPAAQEPEETPGETGEPEEIQTLEEITEEVILDGEGE